MPLEMDFRPVLKKNGISLMGSGRARLLSLIRETGSISTAARQMGMSYRHAWGIVQRMEEATGEKLVRSERGGSGKGKSSLTASGEALLQEFSGKRSKPVDRSSARQIPRLTTDGILVVNRRILLVKRKHDPFKGKYALPGGFVEYGETVEECVVREIKEETGLRTTVERLLGIYSSPDRDPRGHTVSAVFVLSFDGGRLSNSDETIAEWVPIKSLPALAFDHNRILEDYLEAPGKRL